LVLTTVDFFSETVAVKWPVDGDSRHLRNCGKPPAKHQLSVGPLVAAASVAHEDERERAIVLRGSPQNAWDYAGLALEVESALCDAAFADRFANPSQ
jgi:hypothetical protein